MSADGLSEPKARWAVVVEALGNCPGVVQQTNKGFSFGGLMARGRLFANLRRDKLLLKLPSPKVAALIASGDGLPFDAGKGRPMKEWVIVKLAAADDWADLAREAMRFVSE